MKLERTKNSVKGIVSGLINKIILLIIPFIVRTIFINTLGMEYLGLNSLFSSILNILNLAELGVGSAIVFSLYSAIAKNDEKEICALMNFYKKIYRIIGTIVIAIGLVMLPFIKKLCNGSVPDDVNIYILYLMYLANSASSYFLYAYKNCLLTAFQQTYIANNVSTLVKVILNVLQAIFLLLGQGYYVYLGLAILATIAENIINAIFATKKYPDYKAKGEIPKEEKNMIYKKVKALFLYKVGGVVLSSVDSIVISAFLGLTVLGKYNNYYYVITVLFGFLQIYINSMLAGVGNSIASETREKNYKDFNILNFIQGWIVGWCSICLVCLYQPFMELWAGKENMFGIGVAISLAIYFYVWKMMDVTNLYKEAAGLWEYDKFRPLIASAVNLIANILLVQVIGIYGIIISTILSIIVVILPWSTYILYKYYFKTGFKEFWKKYIVNILITAFATLITYGICSLISIINIGTLIIKGIICVVIPNIIYLLLYSRTSDFKETKVWIIDKIKLFTFQKKLKES